MGTYPKTTTINCVLEDNLLYVGSTSKQHLGTVLALLKEVGVEVAFKTPWLDAGEEEPISDVVDLKNPGESILECHFLEHLMATCGLSQTAGW